MELTESYKNRLLELAGLQKEALETKCLTPGAVYKTEIQDNKINITIISEAFKELKPSEAKELEKNIYNAIELALSKLFS